MTNQEKLQQLALLKNPAAAMQLLHSQVLSNLLEQTKSTKGDPGYTPVKGKDYFTSEEVLSIINYIRSQVKDGYTPIKGKDYRDGVDGDPGKPGKPGKDGVTPDINKVAELAAKKVKIPKAEKIEIPTIEQIIAEIEKKPKKISIKDIHDLNDLIAFLKLGGFRGGGGSSTGASGYTIETPTGAVDGVNQTFTVTVVPVYIVSDGTTYFENNGYTRSGLTITMSVPPSATGYIRSFHV